MGTGKVLHCCLLPLGLDKTGLVRSSNRQCSLLATWSTQDVTNTRPPSMKVVYTKDGTRDLRKSQYQVHFRVSTQLFILTKCIVTGWYAREKYKCVLPSGLPRPN
uniref:Uncharacterized protein n=1 Tax=Magallana gigas TaxID=29159 RepID=K1Q3N3_MAGGI